MILKLFAGLLAAFSLGSAALGAPINSYPVQTPASTDTVLGVKAGTATVQFTVGSINTLVTGAPNSWAQTQTFSGITATTETVSSALTLSFLSTAGCVTVNSSGQVSSSACPGGGGGGAGSNTQVTYNCLGLSCGAADLLYNTSTGATTVNGASSFAGTMTLPDGASYLGVGGLTGVSGVHMASNSAPIDFAGSGNPIQVPGAGTASGDDGVFLGENGGNKYVFMGNVSGGSVLSLNSTGCHGWTRNPSANSGPGICFWLDSGGGTVVDLGNGTQGDDSGELKLTKLFCARRGEIQLPGPSNSSLINTTEVLFNDQSIGLNGETFPSADLGQIWINPACDLNGQPDGGCTSHGLVLMGQNSGITGGCTGDIVCVKMEVEVAADDKFTVCGIQSGAPENHQWQCGADRLTNLAPGRANATNFSQVWLDDVSSSGNQVPTLLFNGSGNLFPGIGNLNSTSSDMRFGGAVVGSTGFANNASEEINWATGGLWGFGTDPAGTGGNAYTDNGPLVPSEWIGDAGGTLTVYGSENKSTFAGVKAKFFQTPLTTWTDTQTCVAGQMVVDANYIYVCTATNTVERAALSSF